MTQEQSAREECPLLILKSLLENKEMTFEEIVSSIPYSRGTVNKYLSELFNAELIARKGRRGKYHLTMKGKKETIRRFGESTEKAFNNYLKTIVQLAQEGHAKILTKKELEEIESPASDLSKLPSTLDEQALRSLGIKDSQIEAIKIVEDAVANLARMGYKAGISVKGEHGTYWIIGRKKPKNQGVKL